MVEMEPVAHSKVFAFVIKDFMGHGPIILIHSLWTQHVSISNILIFKH